MCMWKDCKSKQYISGKDDVMKRLTECEEMVMSVIWDAKANLNLPQIVRNVNERYGKTWAMQTVSTFLARLRRKGVVRADREGRTFYYTVLITKQEYTTMITKNLVNLWFDGDVDKLVEALNE